MKPTQDEIDKLMALLLDPTLTVAEAEQQMGIGTNPPAKTGRKESRNGVFDVWAHDAQHGVSGHRPPALLVPSVRLHPGV